MHRELTSKQLANSNRRLGAKKKSWIMASSGLTEDGHRWVRGWHDGLMAGRKKYGPEPDPGPRRPGPPADPIFFRSHMKFGRRSDFSELAQLTLKNRFDSPNFICEREKNGSPG